MHKSDFISKTDSIFVGSSIKSKSPYIASVINEKVRRPSDLSKEILNLTSKEIVFQLYILPSYGSLPISELDPGGGGGYSDDISLNTAKISVDYQFPYSYNQLVLLGHYSNH